MPLKRFRSPTLSNAQAAWFVALVILTLPTVVVVNYVTGPSHSPTETVRRYLEAIREGDVDEALEYVRVDVVRDPTANEQALEMGLMFSGGWSPGRISETGATFLHPDAVSADWEVLEIEEGATELGNTGYEYTDLVSVHVVIGNESGTASGTFLVPAEEPEWIVNGLVPVNADYGADTYLRANDRVIEREVWHTVICCEEHPPPPTFFAMFPGVYEFHSPTTGSEPVAIMPGSEESAFIPAVVPVPDESTTASAQSALSDYIDACVEADTTRGVQFCPFGSDGEVDTEESGRSNLDDEAPVRWEVIEHPTVTLEPVQDRFGLRVHLRVEEPGLLRLSGTGEGQEGEPVDFTALCHFDTDYLVAYFNHDGSAEIRWYESITDDLSEVYEGVGPDSCRGTEA